MMKLYRLTERIWIYPFEEERDRPNLGYIRGNRWSLAVDAGHSDAHLAEFYRALNEESLPMPALTALTHWHWDHTFAMHAVHGLCAANDRTNGHLAAFRDKMSREGREMFLSMDERIRREYEGGKPVVIRLADLVYHESLSLDAGRCPIELRCSPSPHTDDATLIHVPGERVLFLGDASCGAVPGGEKDPALCGALAQAVAEADADIVLESHWTPETKQDILNDLGMA